MLTLAGCIAAWAWWMAAPAANARAASFGALAGLTALARSDLALIVALLALAMLPKRQWRALLVAGGVGLGVVAPWLAWSQVRVGTMVQSSGVAIPSLAAYRIQTSTDFGNLWDDLLFPVINYSLRNTLIYPGASLIAMLTGVLLGRLSKAAGGFTAGAFGDSSAGWRLWLPLLGALLIVLVHTFLRWYPRGWYFAPLALGGAMAGGAMLAAGLATPLGRRFAAGLSLLLGLVVLAQSIKMLDEPEYKWQGDMRAGAEWLAHNVNAAERVGAFNAGIYAYYSGRTVLSLDGLVDWGAIEARQQKRLLDYFVARGGTLVIDHRAYAIDSFSPFFGAYRLEPVVELPTADQTYGPIVVFEVRPQD